MLPHEARKYFPFLDKGKIYFNHAALSPLSTVVTEKIQSYLLQRSEGSIEDVQSLLRESSEAKNKLANMLNTTPGRIAFVDNTSNGLNLLAQGLPWKKGDRILLNDLEFPSNVYPFLNLQQLGVEVDFVKSENGKVTVETILQAITPSTKLLSISFVQFLSGYKADLEEIGKICKANNIIFAVDAIQGLGALQLDVQKCNIDFLASGTQKWLMAMMGLAFVFLSEKIQKKITPKYVGWLSVEDAWNILQYDLKLKTDASVFQTGTLNVIGIYGLNAALDLFASVGFDKIETAVLDNTEYFMHELAAAGFSSLLSGIERKNLSGIVTLKDDRAAAIFEKLTDERVHCSLREGMIRFSPHFYNTYEEIDSVVKILKNTFPSLFHKTL
ncbi:MAG: aminotransferase class V-fold PLP-dependent enzyme [Ignavibacteriaceae bacterium]|jgi:selenocysteine lyase/cysteine desulfurase